MNRTGRKVCAPFCLKKQSIYKPGSVPFVGCLSFIYTLCHHNAKAFYPPARASYPQAPVYMNLQPPRHTARTSLHDRWALTPPSHPYLLAGGYFLLRYSALTNSFLLGSGVLCAARTFLLCLATTATDRLTVYACHIPSAKLKLFLEISKECFWAVVFLVFKNMRFCLLCSFLLFTFAYNDNYNLKYYSNEHNCFSVQHSR